ncbi:DUF1491 family protein [Mangrovicella endophytica]|uniref:DUF1491 family protein n=1 Tax=Mangrovicella endophytica TaxID=2066697 RepID=UPI000C9E1A57|nr:DUF1491 family protein [Mangrovicella endophytica]
MRITSEIFVAQLVRRVFSAGGFAAVGRRGAEAAGAIFVLVRHRGGAIELYGPAVQTESAEDGSRRFMREDVADEEALERRFEREARFDPDFWVVEIEVDKAETFIDIVPS